MQVQVNMYYSGSTDDIRDYGATFMSLLCNFLKTPYTSFHMIYYYSRVWEVLRDLDTYFFVPYTRNYARPTFLKLAS